MRYYVDSSVKLSGDGSKEKPFKKIQMAADIAMPGDEILVLPGIYREEVSPVHAGLPGKPIVYRSLEEKKAIITGAERIDDWTHYQGDVWKVEIENERFHDFNPYTSMVFGDWLTEDTVAHRGEVFLNDKSLYEQTTLEAVLDPVIDTKSWDKDFTKHSWYTCQSEDQERTVIYANFQGAHPNEENVEITFRARCFFPKFEHVDYITLDGFTVTKAATNWAPPTAFQEGMVGPHWSKGWLIQNCDISHSKCSGISLGKYYQQHNDNKWTRFKLKDGTQTQRDCTLIAQLDGWSKDTIGSHTVRNCHIHHCGQTGIVGNLGCVFSTIENCHIHHINNKRNLRGAETGGIKFHAPIDVVIKNNHFHHCVRGVWLDWQTQGTRVTQNLFHDNCLPEDYLLKRENKEGLGFGEDLFLEIAHGPTLVDNNIMLSERCVKLPTQGVAFVHNLFYGAITAVGRGVKNGSAQFDSTRYTPIHRPHSTDTIGFMSILHGDVQFYNNVFVQPEVREGLIEICRGCQDNEWDDENLQAGTLVYNGYMSEEEWLSHFTGAVGEGSDGTRDKYYMPLPVWSKNNAFFNGAEPSDLDENAQVNDHDKVSVRLEEKDGQVQVLVDFLDLLKEVDPIDTDQMPMAFEPEQKYEGPNGEVICFDVDFYGQDRSGSVKPGPFA